MFASPESCYQDDDINDILKANSSSLQLQTVYRCFPNSSSDTYSYTEIEQTSATDGQGVDIEYVVHNGQYKLLYSNQSANSELSFPFSIPYANNDLQKCYSINNINVFRLIENYNSERSPERGVSKTYSDNAKTRTYFNYFTPDYSVEFDRTTSSIKINSINNVKAPEYSDFANEEVLTFKNNINTINNKQFINWSCPLLLNVSGEDERDIKGMIDNIDPTAIVNYSDQYGVEEPRARVLYPIGAGGKLFLFGVDTSQLGTSLITDCD